MSALDNLMALVPKSLHNEAANYLVQVRDFKQERDTYLATVTEREIFEIEMVACGLWSCGYDEYRGLKRSRPLVYARCFMYLYLYKYKKWTQEAIGKHFGGRDHASVHHGLKTFHDLHDTDKHFRAKFAEFIQSITNIQNQQNDQQRTEVSQGGANATAVPTDVLIHRTIDN
jgi:hypothetical protein